MGLKSNSEKRKEEKTGKNTLVNNNNHSFVFKNKVELKLWTTVTWETEEGRL